MKKITLSVFVIALVTFFSCNKNDNNFITYEEEGIISNDAATESVYESMSYETDYFTGSSENIAVIEGGNKTSGFWSRFLYEIGPDITVDPIGPYFPKTITIDYGEGIELVNGRIISGIIQIIVSNQPRTLNATRTINFDNFYIDSIHIEGNILKTCTDTTETQLEYTAISDLVFTFNDGTYITRHAERTTIIEGFETPYDFSDDVFTITGFANSESSEGVTFSRIIVEPLIKKATCRFITQGIVNFSKNNEIFAELNYGEGECDDIATITKDGETRQITLGHRRRIFRT